MDGRGLSKSALVGARSPNTDSRKYGHEASEAQLLKAADLNNDNSQDPALVNAQVEPRGSETPANQAYEQVKTEENLDDVTKKTLKKKKLKSKAEQKIPQIKIRPPDEITKSAIMQAAEASKKLETRNPSPQPEKPQEVPDLGSLFVGMKLGAINKSSKGNKIAPEDGGFKTPTNATPNSEREFLGVDDPMATLLKDANIMELFGFDSRDAEAQALRESKEKMRDHLLELVKAVEDIKHILNDEVVKPLIHNKKTLEKIDPKAPGLNSPRGSSPSPQKQSGNLFSSATLRMNKAKKLLNRTELDHFHKYLPVAFFLAIHFGMTTSRENLLPYVRRMFKDLPSAEPGGIVGSLEFSLRFFRSAAELGEEEFLKIFLKSLKDLRKLMIEPVRIIFFNNSRSDLMLLILEEYDLKVKGEKIKKNSVTLKVLSSSSLEMRSDEKLNKTWVVEESKNEDEDNTSTKKPKQSGLRIHLDFIISTILQCTDENKLLLSLLKNLGLSTATILELLIDQKAEDKIIRISQEVPEFSSSLTKEMVLDKHLYKLLILFDKMVLIEILNEPVMHPETRKETTLYNKLCYLIEEGIMVEGYCNVITNVSETFWDIDKLMVFFNALQNLIYGKKKAWLAYILNPLLFFITLVKFFKDMKSQLDYRDNSITKLTEDILNFCKSYINNSREESFLLNVFDSDSKNLGILDYAMEIGDMNILESEPVESLISEMWNLNRHTMQNLSEFMRLDFMMDEIKKFNFLVFTKEFDVTIEADDKFHLDFEFTSNSIRLKVISEIFWPVMAIVIEMIFSLYLIYYFVIDKDGFDSEWYWQLYQDHPALTIVHAVSRFSLISSLGIKTLAIKHLLRDKPNYMAKFFNTMLFIAFLQMVIYPLFLWKDGNFMFLNITQMLFVMTNIAYISFNALALNQVGVYMRIFFRMTFVVLILGTLSCVIITIIAYPIHTLYINFSQPISGQIFKDLNLFDDLYQGILTLFEFTFGAVVFNRTYLQENFHTYSLTFVMVIFSFFGNIMMANLLVAFLTSQFDQINQNAKYLTMNRQYELINIFNSKGLDTLVAMPYIFALPAVPFYCLMTGKGSKRQSINLLLRKCIHVVNVFLPTFILLNCKLAMLWVWRYIRLCLHLMFRVPFSPIYLVYLLAWIVAGPFTLCKLLYLDNLTICSRLLDFSRTGSDLLNYELGDEARNNLVKLFSRINRVVLHELETGNNHTLTLSEFMSKLTSRSIAESMAVKASASKTLLLDKSQLPGNKTQADSKKEELVHYGKDFNMKYSLARDKDLQEEILTRFSTTAGKESFLDLNFMLHKFRNNITVEKVDRLVSFEKDTLDKASSYFQMEADSNVDQELDKLNEVVYSMDKQVNLLTGKANSMMSLIVQLDAAIPTPSDPNT